MGHLLSGLVCLVNSLQQNLKIDLHISNDYVRVIWYTPDCTDVIDFNTFEWTNDQEKTKSIQGAIVYVTECAVSEILSTSEKEAA